MPPNLKTAVMDQEERSWEDNGSASFIDIVISPDMLLNKRTDGKRSSSSHRPNAMGKGNGNAWAEANELQSNLHVDIGDRGFHLYKFPLISKSGKLNRLVFELRDPAKDRIALHDMPGGAEAFENAVRFLYGNSVQLTSANVAALRCAAEFLEMNESLGDGSLVSKTEQYLNLIVVGSWKDSIAVLRSCSDLKPWAEELEIVRRCSESVAWKASTDPRGLRWSHSKTTGSRDHSLRGWWFDDVCSLYIDTFSKVINAVTAKGMDYTIVAAVVVQYAEKWLGLTKEAKASATKSGQEDSPKSHRDGSIVAFTGFSQDVSTKAQIKKRAILQGIVSLLPSQPDSVSCKFLLKLLRTACAVNAGLMCKTDLARRIGTQLEKVSVDELLIPAYSPASDGTYDIDVVHQIVEYYLQEQSSGSPRMTPKDSAGKLSISGVTSSGASTTSVSSVTTSSSDRSVSGSSDSDTNVTDTSSVSGRSSVSRTSISGTSVSGSSISGSSVSGSSISGTSVSGTSISGTIVSGSSISGTSVSGSSLSGTSISGTSVSGTSISGSSVTGTSVSGSGTSISRTTSSMSDSGSDESTTTGTSSEECVKLDNRFEKKFFSTEGPTSRPQLPPTSSNLRVAQLLETYVEEVAMDSSIPLGKFVALADLFIEFPRESDDCVYRSIDSFLKSHPSLNDLERRKLCKVMDIQALSLNACMHAASNERLPLRVVVSVLFTEQVKLRNAITGAAVVNDKGVDSIPASFSSSASRESYSSESSSDPLSNSTASTDTSTTSLSTASASSSSAYILSIHNSRSVHSVAPSAVPSAAPSAVSSLLPGGLNVKDTLRGALSEIELLRLAVQEIEMVKARLGYMDVLQQEMENMNRKFMDLAHDYTGMTHQVEEMTKASKHKGGWTSGWKKMTKSFNAKDHPDLQKGYNHTLVSEKHLKAGMDTIPLYQQMNSLHSADVAHLQNPRAPVQAARAPVQAAAKPSITLQPLAAPSRIHEAKVEPPVKVVVLPKVEADKAVAVPQVPTLPALAPLKHNGAIDQAAKDQPPPPPPPPSVSSSKVEKGIAAETTPEVNKDSSSHQHKHSKTSDHRGHQSRSQHRASSPPPDPNRSRHHVETDSDTVSISSGSSHSSTHSNRRRRHRDTSSGHRHHHRDGSEEHAHRSMSSHGHGGHKSHHRHRDGSTEHHSSSHHRDRSPDDRHRKDHHTHSKDSGSRPSNHKHGSDHHSGHQSHHSKPHHRSHRKHHHRKDYDSVSIYSSDSGSRPSRNRRHSGV